MRSHPLFDLIKSLNKAEKRYIKLSISVQKGEKDYVKTELVVFLRPTVVRSPSLDADLRMFRRMLPENLERAEPIPSYGVDFGGGDAGSGNGSGSGG